MSFKKLVIISTLFASNLTLAESYYLHVVIPTKFENSKNQSFKTEQDDFVTCLSALSKLVKPDNADVIAWCGKDTEQRY